MVGQAFAIAAASCFPLLFMSVWWRGMTIQGAATGMLTGGLLALGGISLTSFSDLQWINLEVHTVGPSPDSYSVLATRHLGPAFGHHSVDRGFQAEQVLRAGRYPYENADPERPGKTWPEAGIHPGIAGRALRLWICRGSGPTPTPLQSWVHFWASLVFSIQALAASRDLSPIPCPSPGVA